MTVPIADLQKEIKTPNVAKGEALNFSENIKQTGALAQNTIEKLQNSTNLIGKFLIAEEQADEQQKADEAYSSFAEKAMEALNGLQNTEAHQTAVHNKKIYTPQMEKIDFELISNINNIKDPVVREKLRLEANNFKINQRMKAEGYVFSQKKAAEKISTDKFIATKQQTFLNDVNYDSENNLTVFERDLRDIRYRNSASAVTVDGIIDKRYVELKTQESADKMAENSVRKMEELADSKDFFGGYAEVKKYLKKIQKHLSPEKYRELASQIDSRELEVEILRNTDKFLKKGQIDRALVYQHGENLSYYEKEKMLQRLEKELKEKNSNLSKEDVQDKEEMESAQAGMVVEAMNKVGLKSKDHYNFLKLSKNLKNEELDEIKAKDFKNVNPIEAFKAYSTIQSEMEKAVPVRSGKKLYIRSKEAEAASEALAEYLDFFINTYDDELIETEGVIEGVFGKERTIEEDFIHRAIKAAIIKNKDGDIVQVKSRSALSAGATFFRNTEKLGIDTTQKIEDSPYEKDENFKKNILWAEADALLAGKLSIKNEFISDSSFTNSYKPTLSPDNDPMETAKDILGPQRQQQQQNINLLPQAIRLTAIGNPMLQPWVEPSIAAINYVAEKKRKKFEKDVKFVSELTAAQEKYKKKLEEDAKKMVEESKKKNKGATK